MTNAQPNYPINLISIISLNKTNMKKILVMTLAAFVAMSCAKESGVDKKGGGDDMNGKATHVQFTFKLDGGKTLTRALADYNPEEELYSNDAGDEAFDTGDLHMLIFNANTGALEHKVAVTGNSMSMVLTAGPKKFFVFANTAALADNVSPVGTATFTDRYDALTVNSNVLDDIYAKAFSYSAGTPQANGMTDAEKNVARTFLLKNLHTRVADPTKGIPMSSTAELTYDVKANVSAAEAATGPDNKFVISIYYMLAKARMQMGATAMATKADGTIISDPFYAVKNLATNTSYVQKWGTNGPESYYHNDFDGSTPATTYPNHFDRAATVNIPFSTTPGDYTYVSENTSKLLYRGQSSYFAVKLTYKPGKVATAVAHDPNDVFAFSDYKALGTGGGETGSLDYVYVHTNITLAKATIPAGTYITNLATFKEALWIAENDKAWAGTAQQGTEADALIASAAVKDNYYGFANATSWYRLDIGEGAGAATKYGVLRGNRYTATINNITGPGKPKETDLDDNSDQPVVTNTYINASIKAEGWKDVAQGNDLQ